MIEFEIGHQYEMWDTVYGNSYIRGTVQAIKDTCIQFLVSDSDIPEWIGTTAMPSLSDFNNGKIICAKISKHKQIKSPFLMGYKIND